MERPVFGCESGGGDSVRELVVRETVRESVGDAREAFASLDFYVVLFGFAFCRAWIVLCLSVPFVALSEGVDWIFLMPGGVAMLALAMLAASRFARAQQRMFDRRFKAATGVFVGLCVLGAPFAVTAPSWVVLVVFLVACGVASSCLQALWGVGFARRRPSFSLYCYPASAVVTAFLVVGALMETGLLALCVYPVASFLLLLVCTSRGYRSEFLVDDDEAIQTQAAERGEAAGGELLSVVGTSSVGAVAGRPEELRGSSRAVWSGADRPGDRPLPAHTIARLLVSIAVFSLLCRLYDKVPGGMVVDPLLAVGGSSVFALVVTGVAFLVFAVALGRAFNPLLGYRIALPLMALGMAVIALFFADHWYLSVLLIGMGYELFDTLTWMLLVALAQNRAVRLSAYSVFGLGTAATLLGMGAGRFVGDWLAFGVAPGAPEVSSMGVVGVMALVVTAFLVIPEGTFAQLAGRRPGERDGSAQASAEQDASGGATAALGASNPPTLETACETVAAEHRLTPRESEVLVLLARGRTLAIVMRDLGIAKGTAQTHIENIYQKLGVHKQQELIDLVESYIQP